MIWECRILENNIFYNGDDYCVFKIIVVFEERIKGVKLSLLKVYLGWWMIEEIVNICFDLN